MERDSLEANICKAFLHSGQDLNISDGLSVHHPTVQEILALGGGIQCESIYWAYVQTIASDPYNYMVWLDDKGIDYETVSPFDVFALRWMDAKDDYLKNKSMYDSVGYIPEKMFSDALSFFLGHRNYRIASVGHGKFYIGDPETPGWCFSADIYNWICTFVRLINCMTNVNKIRPASKSAKRILIEDTRDELKRAQRSSRKEADEMDVIGNSVSTLVCGGNGGVTPFNFMDLHIYQLLTGASITHNQMRVHAMLNGIYTGMLGTNNLSDTELCWTKV